MTDFRRPQLLDLAHHEREAFDCGEPSLDVWLKRFAGQDRGGNTAATWVIVDDAGVVVGYASLSMTGIERSTAPAPLAKRAPDPIPALQLGRLAVDRSHSGLGIGTSLVAHVLATAVDLNQRAACKAVVVTALHERARSWWSTRFGFEPLDPTDPEGLDLYLLTTDIEATLERLG